MKTLHKIAVTALSAVLITGCAACEKGGSSEGDYADPNSAFSSYDNLSYNEYLLGEQAAISNQWEGYGIGDPFVMRWNGKYYLYCSSLDSETGVRGYVSADLVNWEPMTGQGLTEGYVSQDTVTQAAYAPEVYYFNGTFYMYTSPAGNGHYVLTAENPEGPFVKATNNFQLSIDGSVLIDDDESMYFTFADNSGIRIAKMDDMLNVNAASMPVLGGTSIGGWTEGPYILKRDGVYYLTYTGNHVASDGYRIAYSTADHVVTEEGDLDRVAFKKAFNNPLALETEGDLKGIGHSSTVLGPDLDSHYLVYHYLNSSGGPNRSLGVDRLTFNGTMMSVAPMLTGSIAPKLPSFYANGGDEEKFDSEGTFLLSKTAAEANFTAEYNFTGSGAEFVFGYRDGENYCSVKYDFDSKQIVLSETVEGVSRVAATGTLKNEFSYDDLHTVRVTGKDGKVTVVFDNMTKISGVAIGAAAGKIGYKGAAEGAVGYTAFSNGSMGESDKNEAKQATGWIGSSLYLEGDEFAPAPDLGQNSKLQAIAGDELSGVQELKLGAKGDGVSYLVNFPEEGRYGMEFVYRASDGGKKVEVTLANGKSQTFTLPKVDTEEEFVRALAGSLYAEKGIAAVRIENAGSAAVSYCCFRFTEVTSATPSYECDLSQYAQRGVDYKTIWKLKDGGHYAKAGTRQLVYFGDNTITDFTLEVDIKLEGSTGTSTAGIVFRAKNYASSTHDGYMSIQGYYLSVNNSYMRLERLNFADGSSTLVTVANSMGNPFKTSDEFITLKIQVRGNNIKVYNGKTALIDYDDAFAFANGKAGLYTNGAAVIFRNLKIYG